LPSLEAIEAGNIAMRVWCNREALLAAIGMASGALPARSPKAVLQNMKLVAETDNNVVLMATDLEIGIRQRVASVRVEEPGSVILPTLEMGSILRTGTDTEFALWSSGQQLAVEGTHCDFNLLIDDVHLFPEIPDFGAVSYYTIAAASLRKMIRRTVFATDAESSRYALGGVLVELGAGSLGMVGTDGRRLARMSAPVEAENEPIAPGGSVVIPVKALKLVERNLADDDPPVHFTVEETTALLLQSEDAVIYTRLLEGRFPRYQDVFPANVELKIPLDSRSLRIAVEQAAVVASEESRGVEFEFSPGVLKLSSQSVNLGSSHVQLPIPYDGKVVYITFDPRYLLDALKTLEDTTLVTAELVDAKTAAVFRTDDQYTYVVMPLTRERA
jgi:DNA polymerase-3 subunit beta